MKQLILTISFALCIISFAKAQTPEVISKLSPLPKNAKKFSKKIPKNFSYSEFAAIEFNVKAESLNLPNGKTGVAVTIQTTNDELAYIIIREKVEAKVRFYERIFSDNKKIDAEFEEIATISLNETELQKAKRNPVFLRKVFELPEGNYKIGIVVKDIQSGIVGVKVIKFQIPSLKKSNQ